MRALNILFHIAHLSFITFSALAWMSPALRPAHLMIQATVLFSWFILGYWKGWTYCFLTDLHWRVRRRMGLANKTDSYIKYMIDRATGKDANPEWVNRGTVTVFFVTTALSSFLFLTR